MNFKPLRLTILLASAGLILIVLQFWSASLTRSAIKADIPREKLALALRNLVESTNKDADKAIDATDYTKFNSQLKPALSGFAGNVTKALNGEETTWGTFSASENEQAELKTLVYNLETYQKALADRFAEHENTVVERDSLGQIISVPVYKSDAVFSKISEVLLKTAADMTEDSIRDINALQNKSVVVQYVSFVFISILIIVLIVLIYFNQVKIAELAGANREAAVKQENSVNAITGFIESVSSGNYATSLDDSSDTSLTTALLSMRDKLKSTAEEDNKRNWSTSGLAKIGEILRETTASKEELYDHIIQFVVKYSHSNQGGLFLLNDELESQPVLELVSCYAYERKKFLNKTLSPGQGLTGQCFLEGQTIYLLEVPEDYIMITSGLGGAVPSALLLVPLKVNGKIFGVLELASFTAYAAHEIELVEKLAESIGATISNVKVNESTRILLEKTQQQAEEMRAQEEEMRQNMEELEATQEEMRRKEKHVQTLLEAEQERNDYSKKGRVILMELTKDADLQGGNWHAALEKITRAITIHLGNSRCSVWTYHAGENKIRNEKLYQADMGTYEHGLELFGKDFPNYFRAVKAEETIVASNAHTHPATSEFSTVYLKPLSIESMLDVPFFSEGHLGGVICCENQGRQMEWTDEQIEFLKSCADLVTVSYNTSRMNLILSELESSHETLQTIIDNLPRSIFWKDSAGKFLGCNRNFALVAGLDNPAALIGKTDFDMPWREHADAYRADDLAVMQAGIPRLNQEERNVNNDGIESWVLTSKVPVMDHNGHVIAVLGMFEDITERKRTEQEINRKLEELAQLRKQ